jgi:hypothetical protein
VTAEFAVALPAVLLVLAACLGGLRLGLEQVRVTDGAALAARSLARGDGRAGAEALARKEGVTALSVERTQDGLICVVAHGGGELLPLPLPVTARSCALGAASP